MQLSYVVPQILPVSSTVTQVYFVFLQLQLQKSPLFKTAKPIKQSQRHSRQQTQQYQKASHERYQTYPWLPS